MGKIALHPATAIKAPERLSSAHELSGFASLEPGLDAWLRKHALKNEGTFSRTYVTCAGNSVIGFYAITNGSVQHSVAVPKSKRNAPDPIPVIVLGRLAVDKNWMGRGVGSALLRDAILRVLQASEIAGIAAILVHAISDAAKLFYKERGFSASELEPMTLMITLKEARAAFDL